MFYAEDLLPSILCLR